MDKDILTFEEWVANSICIAINAGNVKVFSLQANKVFFDIKQVFEAVSNDYYIKEFKKGIKSEMLKEIYNKHYYWIQEQHQKWLQKNN